MKRRLAICPFTNNEYPLLKCLEKDYIIESLISPQGIGEENEDIAILRNSKKTGLHFINNIEHGIKLAETVIISCVSKDNTSLYDFAISALEHAIDTKKEIICYLLIDEEIKTRIEEKCKQCNIKITFPSFPVYPEEAYRYTQRIKRIDVPVVYINELAPGCESYDFF